MRITDLHEGVVWGTQTAETRRDPGLTNRFDHDPVFGTVLNRFMVQAIEGRPLSVYGSGQQAPLCQGSCPLLYFFSISQVGGIG